MRQRIIVIIFAAVFIFIGGLFLFKEGLLRTSVSEPLLIISPSEYDFGKVLQSIGSVSTTFDVINKGGKEVKIESVLTSCSCTSAEIDRNIIKVGETAKLKVSFDPNYHFESYEKFFRTISVKYNGVKEAETKIFVQVEYDLGLDKLKYGK